MSSTRITSIAVTQTPEPVIRPNPAVEDTAALRPFARTIAPRPRFLPRESTGPFSLPQSHFRPARRPRHLRRPAPRHRRQPLPARRPRPRLAHPDGGRPLAAAAYEERARPSGALDPQRLSVLADGLEEAGCADATILGHLRGPGPHVRGCWALDLLLGQG